MPDRILGPLAPIVDERVAVVDHGDRIELTALADLDAWALSSGKVTHGSKDYTGVSVGVGGLWESKLGPTERITHGRTGLTSTGYGSIVGTLGPGFNVTAFERCAMVMNDPLPAYGLERLTERLQAVPPDLREAFERHFASWKQTWFAGAASRSSDSNACATGEAFEALLAMGPAILPLVVERLQEEENFVALVLYDRLQSDPDLKITYEESDPRAIEGEQSRSQRTIRKWLDIE